jgi:deoxycytidylate deaminase
MMQKQAFKLGYSYSYINFDKNPIREARVIYLDNQDMSICASTDVNQLITEIVYINESENEENEELVQIHFDKFMGNDFYKDEKDVVLRSKDDLISK